jgi:GntR family transcriptional regulator / MocR family aminotransferase
LERDLYTGPPGPHTVTAHPMAVVREADHGPHESGRPLLTLQPSGTRPLYEQITEGLQREIADGTLPTGTRLPSSRQLARDLRVSRITVVTAYAELEAAGAIEARGGSGTYVLPPWTPPQTGGRGSEPADSPAAPPLPPWQRDIVHPVNLERHATLGQVLRGPLTHDTIGFAWGAGDSRLIPMTEFRRALGDVLDRDGATALGPEGGAGYPPLRHWLADYLQQNGLDATPDDILVTSGTQQTISLVAATLLQPGDRVITEAPTWPGALEVFEAAGAHVVGIPLDAGGMRNDRLVEALEQARPRLIYTVPTFQNPTGAVMTARRRRALCTLAEQYGVPILEDDHVREVRFGQPIPPPMAAFDRRGDVIHAGGFTKSLIPSLRIGYVVARGPLREALMARKRTADLFGSALMQRALWSFLESGAVARHWRRVSRIYQRRHTAMLRALEKHFPPGSQWSGVSGGLVLWVRLPEGISVAALYDVAAAAAVGFARGAAFFPEPADQPYLRLNFAAVDEAEIERGIAVLGGLAYELVERGGLNPPAVGSGRHAAR